MASNCVPLLLLSVLLLKASCRAAQLGLSESVRDLNSKFNSYDLPFENAPSFRGDENKSTSTSGRNPRQSSQSHLIRRLRERFMGYHDASFKSWEPSASRVKSHERVVRQEEVVTEVPLQQQQDLVEKLPGQPPVEFAQYSGYVTVNETAGRALFYWLTEATSRPATKPLILWLNGGPGCSSVGYGEADELGPFRVNQDGATLRRNPHAWNRVSNVLFVESPVGVGFSYSNTSSDYFTNGDERTAIDSLQFLLNWFERFPQYKFREFYITGESYAGNYVPQLAQKLVVYNKGLAEPSINFKGFMVGNAVINADTDIQGTIDYLWTHALISDETYSKIKDCFANTSDLNRCAKLIDDAYKEQGNIDPYDIYTPVCLDTRNSTTFKRHSKGPGFLGYDPCSSDHITVYFNRPDVQQALHANVTGMPFPWMSCSDLVNINWRDSAPSVLPIYEELIAAGLKIWVFSGDVDSVVPVTATKYSLALLKLRTTVPWHAWYLNQQVGGYTQGYEGLTFVTVRGSGHEVPLFQPARALSIITSFLTGVPLHRS